LKEWASLPKEQTPEQRGSLAEVFLKEFRTIGDMLAAVAGHTLAKANRVKEERLAFAVLEQLENYEVFVLDPLLKKLVETLDESFAGWKSGYGAMADILCGKKDILNKLNAGPDLERLYKKVAFLHEYNLKVAKLAPPRRSEHAGMRMGKWTLVETDPQVIEDRRNHVPVWSGTSGSCMDMINLARSYGCSETQLTALAWCIAAFFHFMPIVRSPTHTYHEVMRGAHKIIGHEMLDYGPGDVAIPDCDFAAKYLSGRAKL
jgi:hypothetical protein